MLFIEYLFRQPDYFISWIVVISFSICVHEFCHAYAATSQGDDTPARGGYLTLDPRKLMGIQSLIMLAFIGFAWGAVPVNTRRMKHPYSPVLVACAGPVANLLLAVCFAVLLALLSRAGTSPGIRAARLLVQCGLQGNCLLAVFNMLPVPLLDGWELYSFIFPPLKRIDRARAATVSWIVILLIWLTPLGNLVWKLVGTLGNALANLANGVIP